MQSRTKAQAYVSLYVSNIQLLYLCKFCSLNLNLETNFETKTRTGSGPV